ISVIPNGVDFEAFDNRPHLPRQSDHLMFTGALDYAPNIAAARFLAQEVLPKIRERHPSARLSIVGRDPAVEVTDLDKRPGVSVVGPVDDMGDALSTASIYLCPMISGTGIKNKLLEALANGLPCVASELAVRGTRLKHGAELLIANTPDEIADASVRLLSDERLREELSEAGRRFVIANHTWMSVADQYSRIYREVIATADA
ncbi:MAG: glycosyltransferase family 4 protein, partial [Acidimicrobiia bacterium]|nr:glycosyltransferase family 4 protein [Acidimicrobiia bacterium]